MVCPNPNRWTPGLEYCGSHVLANPDARENDAVTRAVCHDRMAVLGLDDSPLGDAAGFERLQET